jgi:hypothetical protein
MWKISTGSLLIFELLKVPDLIYLKLYMLSSASSLPICPLVKVSEISLSTLRWSSAFYHAMFLFCSLILRLISTCSLLLNYLFSSFSWFLTMPEMLEVFMEVLKVSSRP